MVSEEEKAGLVSSVFANVAPSYDVMNDLMSGGLHRLWKDRSHTFLDTSFRFCVSEAIKMATLRM